MTETVIEVTADIALCVAWAGTLTFVVAYQLITRGAWRKGPYGRNAMAVMTALLAVLTVAMARLLGSWLDDHLDALRLIAFLVASYIAWRRVQLLFLAQRRPGLRNKTEKT